MAISLVGTAGGGDDNAAFSINLPVGTTTGDLVRVFAAVDGRHSAQTGAVSPINVTTSGYTLLALIDGLTYVTCGLWEKVMGGTPDTTVAISNPGTDGAFGMHALVRVYRGADTTTPSDAAPVETSSDNATSPPDNGSITTVTDNAWVEAYVYHATGAGDDETFTAPTGYTDKAEGYTTGSGIAANVAGATKLVATAGAENPSSWGGTSGNIWGCITAAVRPAAVAAGSAKNMLLLGVG